MKRKVSIALFIVFTYWSPRMVVAQFMPYTINDPLPEYDAPRFTVGRVLFVYDYHDFPKGKNAANDLSKLLPVDRVLLHAAPCRALNSLIAQTLETEHRFEFLEATFSKQSGDESGYIWRVTWELFPTGQGMGGVPYRYVAFVAGDGAIIEPRRYLYDSYPGWGLGDINSVLSFSKLEADDKDAKPLFGEAILDIANKRMKTFAEECQANIELKESQIPAIVSRLKFLDQKLMHIPIRDTNTGIVTKPVWVVRFIDEQIAEDEKKLARPPTFTVWVTPSGEAGDLKATPWDDGYERAKREKSERGVD